MTVESNQVKGPVQRSRSVQEMSRPLRSCLSAVGTKRLRDDDGHLFPCSDVISKRVRGESAEGSLNFLAPPMPSCLRTSSSLTDLPDAILLEIFLRLPVKTAFRCKSLSKRCCSVISSYYSSRNSFTLMFQYDLYVKFRPRRFQVISDHPLLSEAYTKSNFDMSFLPFMPRQSNDDGNEEEMEDILSSVTLEGCCDDLVLCSDIWEEENIENHTCSSMIQYFICNVVSRQYVALTPVLAPPPPPPKIPSTTYRMNAIVGFLCEEKGTGAPDQNSGLAYGTLAFSRFAVVCIPCFSQGDDVCDDRIGALVFCSDTDCWSTSIISTHPRKLNRFLPAGGRLLAHKDKLHWLTAECIAVFDPFKDRERFCRMIDLPDGFAAIRQGHAQGFGVCQSRLRVASLTLQEYGNHDPDDPALRVWEVEDYDRGSWCLVFKVSLADIVGRHLPWVVINRKTRLLTMSSFFFGVLAFHPYERDIVYLRAKGRIFRCNMRTQTEEEMYRLLGLDCSFHVEAVDFEWKTAFQLVHRWSLV